MRHISISHIAFVISGILFAASISFAESSTDLAAGSPEEAGLRIATEARERQRGYEGFTANMTMTLRTKQGRESQRIVRIKVIEIDGDGDRTLFVFDRPADVKGTAFLIHAHKNKPDQQWLYLPALKRVKGISSSNQSGSFMGSEFTYEDLGTTEVEKFSYRYLGDEPCGDLNCYKLERIPTDKASGYTKQLVWLDHEELRNMKVEYFDRRGAHLKTMSVDGYKQYLDRFWRSSLIKMVNHLTNKETDLEWSDYVFGGDLSKRDFTKTALKRVK